MTTKVKTLMQKEIQLAKQSSDEQKVRHHLGRAHILSQQSMTDHLYIHVLMFLYAVKTGNMKEVIGQIIRLVVTAPGHLLGKVPQGNIGWSTVPLTQKMELPEDLKGELEAPLRK